MDGFTVTPDVLDAASESLLGVIPRLEGQGRLAVEALRSAVRAAADAALVSELQGVAFATEAAVSDAGRSMVQVCQGLRTTAHDYRTADSSVASGFTP